MTPTLRVILRALVVFATTTLAQLQASDTWDGTLIRSAVAGGILALLEFLTPLNPNVGPGKTV